jgi:hypothetical protein
VSARVLPVLLVLGALAADALGHSGPSFALLVASVPAAAVSALSLFGRLVESPGLAIRLETSLAALGLVCVVVAAAVRGQAPDPSTLPALAASAALAALGIYGVQTIAVLLWPGQSSWLRATNSRPRLRTAAARPRLARGR